MSPTDRLHPVVLHHIVNSLGWADLRPLQEAAIDPLLAGDDALLLAPTAGGKTEAATFPLLSRMATENWRGTSVLYLCPLKALLNNLLPRLEQYTGWLGRRTALWHGDVTAPTRCGILRDRPDVLLTTPESLEGMLVSVNVDHRSYFADLRTVVVDEVHAFAGDDRGWHLIALLERLTHLIGRPVQRIGLSATVGNPEQLLTWLQGSGAGKRPAHVIAPDLAPARSPAVPAVPAGDIELDYVGSIANAATVIASLHRGEKRLVFCESRKTVEELGQLLRAKGITTFLSHASLAAEDRRRSEQAFAEARDCVIVSTSTLELGIDVGDLVRVIQLDTPATVASFLQRLGRTGRRPGTTRNCLFLARDHQALLQAAALLLLWGRGWVERVLPPPEPRHIVAQQLDWNRRRCFVEPADSGGRARWLGLGWTGLGHDLTRAMRDVLLGDNPPVRLTRRAATQLAAVREEQIDTVHPGGTVIRRDDAGEVRWWTWAGFRANATLTATLGDLADPMQRFEDHYVRLREDLDPAVWRAGTADASEQLCLPEINERALAGLKFSTALPKRLATATLAARLSDLDAAALLLKEPTRFVRGSAR